MQLWRRLVSSLLDVLSPPACPACDAPCPDEQSFCSACGGPAPPNAALEELSGVPVLVAGCYEPPLSTAIVRFKYGARPELSRPLSRLLLPALTSAGLAGGVTLVPVPLHPRRLATRGYNQAALLAQELASQTRLGCRPRLLRRTREMERQVGKSRDQRLHNAAGAFELGQAAPAEVILVDDVITTGSTVRACAQALAAGRVQLRAVIALARAERGKSGLAPASQHR